MARKSGGFNKLLNFIGLVDDEDTRDTYGEEYSERGYGRQSGYSPARQTRPAANSRTASYSRANAARTPQPDSPARTRTHAFGVWERVSSLAFSFRGL